MFRVRAQYVHWGEAITVAHGEKRVVRVRAEVTTTTTLESEGGRLRAVDRLLAVYGAAKRVPGVSEAAWPALAYISTHEVEASWRLRRRQNMKRRRPTIIRPRTTPTTIPAMAPPLIPDDELEPLELCC